MTDKNEYKILIVDDNSQYRAFAAGACLKQNEFTYAPIVRASTYEQAIALLPEIEGVIIDGYFPDCESSTSKQLGIRTAHDIVSTLCGETQVGQILWQASNCKGALEWPLENKIERYLLPTPHKAEFCGQALSALLKATYTKDPTLQALGVRLYEEARERNIPAAIVTGDHNSYVMADAVRTYLDVKFGTGSDVYCFAKKPRTIEWIMQNLQSSLDRTSAEDSGLASHAATLVSDSAHMLLNAVVECDENWSKVVRKLREQMAQRRETSALRG
jgi:hypothetical protein